MICPVISRQYSGSDYSGLDCYEKDCAWYCPDSKMCAIKKIALKDDLIVTPATTYTSQTGETMLFSYGS